MGCPLLSASIGFEVHILAGVRLIAVCQNASLSLSKFVSCMSLGVILRHCIMGGFLSASSRSLGAPLMEEGSKKAAISLAPRAPDLSRTSFIHRCLKGPPRGHRVLQAGVITSFSTPTTIPPPLPRKRCASHFLVGRGQFVHAINVMPQSFCLCIDLANNNGVVRGHRRRCHGRRRPEVHAQYRKF